MKRKKARARKRNKRQKIWFKAMIPGDHRVRFYRDAKSGHPFMGISKNNELHFGHEMTESPSLLKTGGIKNRYIRFRKNPNPNDKEKSYYRKAIKRIVNTTKGDIPRLVKRKNWKITNHDLKVLKRIDKKRIKNVRRADD